MARFVSFCNPGTYKVPDPVRVWRINHAVAPCYPVIPEPCANYSVTFWRSFANARYNQFLVNITDSGVSSGLYLSSKGELAYGNHPGHR